MYWEAGDPFLAKDTVMVRNCGIRSGARGYVTYVEGGRVSFYLDLPPYGVEAVCSLESFGMNFDKNPLGPRNLAYKHSQHYTKRFPEDLFAGR